MAEVMNGYVRRCCDGGGGGAERQGVLVGVVACV